MPEFKEIQKNLQQIRKQREAEQQEIFQARESLKKINRQKKDLSRSEPESEKVRRLNEQEQELRSYLSDQETRLKNTLQKERGLLENFQPLSDPRKNIKELSDQFPILLFPVRLETRFKKVAGSQYQLWVRIFPDNCSIDTFEETLSEGELKNVRNYWITLWKAGQSEEPAIQAHIRNLRKGAWKGIDNGMSCLSCLKSIWPSSSLCHSALWA